MDRIIVAGAGVFGVTAAIELRKRGHAVRLVDPGPLPHPLAASTDISKVVRLEYGADEAYTALAEQAIAGWQRWNRELGSELFHETGLLFLRRTPLAPGTLEQDSLDVLRRRGHEVEVVDADAIRSRFPAWNAERYPHGTFNPEGGFVESGKVIARLVEEARRLGVDLREGESFFPQRLQDADQAVLALGAWTPHTLPLARGGIAVHRAPGLPPRARRSRCLPRRPFPVFCADIQNTGWYGFPLLDGAVKVARHGGGRPMHPESPERQVTAEETGQLRSFLAETFPGLANAPIVQTRICLYCDSRDGHFWIARDPGRPRVVIASGDSGHAFKFAPVLGALVADVVEGRSHPLEQRFRWRPGLRPVRSQEAARFKA